MVFIKAKGKIVGHCEIYRKADRLKIKTLTIDAEYLDVTDLEAIEFQYSHKGAKTARKGKKE